MCLFPLPNNSYRSHKKYKKYNCNMCLLASNVCELLVRIYTQKHDCTINRFLYQSVSFVTQRFCLQLMCFSNIHVLYLCKLSKRINISSVICFRVECDTITNPDSSSFSSKDSFTITTQCSHCVGFSTRQSLISSSISETLLSRVSIRSLQNFFELFPTITLKNTI